MKLPRVKWIRVRLGLVFLVFVLIWGGIVWRALQLQVLEADRLAKMAERECYKVIRLNPVRGNIYDRRGEKLAVSLEADSVFAHPVDLKNPDQAAAALAKVLHTDRSKLAQRLKSDASFVWVKRQITPTEVAKVQALKIEGVGFLKESKRFYPNKSLASHILGFVGVDSVGLEGLERGYDEYLRGGVNRWRVQRDALGRTYLDRDVAVMDNLKGADVTLTIDRRIQYVVEKALAEAVKTYGAKGGQVLVMRPHTGEILAAAVAPGFNPNVFSRYPISQRRFRILSDTFDPGSTFKVFVVAAALEEGLVRPNDKFFCEKGSYTIVRNVVHDHKPYGWLTVDEIIQHSSNIGTVKVSEKLGDETLYRYLNRFSFGQRTGVDFPGESPGLLRSYKNWRQIDAANIAFGQGLSVTSMQLGSAMSVLVNDGILMRPFLVSEIRDSQGRLLLRNKPEIVRQVISPQTAREVRTMLRLVVADGGTGVLADSPEYPAAGKTGTAQKLDPVTKRYSNEKYFSSFLGYVPYQKPELVIFVGLDEPGPKIYGGTVAAPVFREIARQVLPMLDVTPVSIQPPEGGEPENIRPPKTLPKEALVTKKEEDAAEAAIERIRRKLLGLKEAQAAEAEVLPPKVTEASDSGTMPDLAGLSMRQAMDLLQSYGVDVNFSGSGQVVWQDPQPGQTVELGQVCRVRCEQW